MAEYQNQMIVGWKKYDRILVKANVDGAVWQVALFDSYNEDNPDYPFRTTDNRNFAFALPYEGNEELIGTSYSSLDEALNPYKFGDKVRITNDDFPDESYIGIYVARSGKSKTKHLVVLEPKLCKKLNIPINQAIRTIKDGLLSKE